MRNAIPGNDLKEAKFDKFVLPCLFLVYDRIPAYAYLDKEIEVSAPKKMANCD